MIACLRTLDIPEGERSRFLAWIAEARSVREAHGILAELDAVSSDTSREETTS